jgi:5-hydroxyisourate hydrolase
VSLMRIAAQVLDSTYGRAAEGIRVRLERADGNGWAMVAAAQTNNAGRIEDLDDWNQGCGLYRIIFDSDGYFAGLGASTAYPEVLVVFRIQNESDICQVQVTLSPYSYSTHFGAERQLAFAYDRKGPRNGNVQPRSG